MANLLPLSRADVGGFAAPRAEGQIVPKAALRAPSRLCSPRPRLPGPGDWAAGEGCLLRLADSGSPLAVRRVDGVPLGKVIGFQGSLRPRSAEIGG